MNRHQYTIEKHTLGWLVFPAPEESGVPPAALSEVAAFAGKEAGLHPGISNATRSSFALGKPEDMKQWAAEIETKLAQSTLPKELQWLRGTKVGASSRTLFTALCEPQYIAEAKHGSFQPSLPLDADDLGRCVHLVQFMGWGNRLLEVAKYPPTLKWAPIAENWLLLVEHLNHGRRQEIYDFLHHKMSNPGKDA